MSEIRFYHLTTHTLEQAVPALLSKAVSGGRRVLVQCPEAGLMKKLNEQLWTYRQDSFLPHGLASDPHAELQPILLTDQAQDGPANEADMLMLCGGAENTYIDTYALCCEMLEDHHTDQVQAARARWKSYKEAGHTVTYWFQNEKGGWEQKA